MKKRVISILLCAVLAVSALTACGSSSAPADGGSAAGTEGSSDVKAGGTMIIGMAAEPITLNPNGKSDDNMSIIAPNLFSKLMKITATGKVVCDLAESVDISDDSLEYTFKLPENVKWSDGEALTSDDVKFTFEEIVKQGCFASGSLACISAIDCPDDTTVVIKLSEVNAAFLGTLGYQGVFILPRHVYEGKDWMGADGMQEPVGSGPFVLKEWKSGVSFEMEKNPNFYMGPDLPYLDGIIYSFISDVDTATQAFTNHDLDILGVIPSDAVITSLMGNPDYKMCTNMYASRFYLAVNMDKAPYGDLNVRMAIAQALDIDDLIKKAMQTCCVKAEGYVSPLFEYANDPASTIPEHNKDEAIKALEAAGLKKDADGFYLHATLDTYNYEPFPSMCQVIKAQLAEVGIDVSINMLEYAAWDENVAQNRDFEMTVTAGYVGPDVADMGNRIVTGGYFNLAGYSNPELDELMVQGTQVADEADRAPIYQQVCKILREDQPMIMIGEWVAYTPIPAYVHGFPMDEDMTDVCGTSDYVYTWME